MSYKYIIGPITTGDAGADATEEIQVHFDEDCILMSTYGQARIVISGSDGDITIHDSYTLPATDGEAGQVLQTDGSGNLTWVDQTTGSSGGGSSEEYEFGSWTPQGNGFTFTVAEGHYQKFGRMVSVTFKVRFPSSFAGSVGSNACRVENLPYTSMPFVKGFGSLGHISNGQSDARLYVASNSTNIKIVNNSDQSKQNANFQGALLQGGATYFVSGSV